MRYLTGLRARRRRGEGRRATRASSSSAARTWSCWPTRATRSRSRREAPEARIVEAYNDLPARWPELMASVGARRVAVEAGFVSQAVWSGWRPRRRRSSSCPVEGWVEADRAVKEPAEVERIAAACAVADRGAGRAAARDPAGRDRGGPRAPARVADADRRRRGPRLRRRLPVRSRGGAAARLARRPAGARGRGPAVRLRGAGRRAIAAT